MSTIIATTLSNGSVSVPTATVVNGSAKAWVNFNGTGTIAARDSENVSSLTDNGTGDYTVNFTGAFGAADYVFHVYTGTDIGNTFRGARGIAIAAGSILYRSIFVSGLTGQGTPEDDKFQFVSTHGDLA